MHSGTQPPLSSSGVQLVDVFSSSPDLVELLEAVEVEAARFIPLRSPQGASWSMPRQRPDGAFNRGAVVLSDISRGRPATAMVLIQRFACHFVCRYVLVYSPGRLAVCLQDCMATGLHMRWVVWKGLKRQSGLRGGCQPLTTGQESTRARRLV